MNNLIALLARRLRRFPLSASVVAGASLGAAFSPVMAQGSDLSMKGQTITVTIGFSTGGNYDFVGRLVARHIGKHIPGQPNGIAVNMPGAGSIRAANHLFNVAPRDGTTLGIVSSSIAVEEALGTPNIQYRAAEFGWVGRVSMILQVLSTLDPARAKSFKDTLVYETTMGATGPGSPSEGYPRLLNGLFGAKFKIIGGYKSSTEVMLAMERGEVDGGLPSWNTIKRRKADWIETNKIHPLVQFVFERSPDLPNTPTSIELGRTAAERDTLSFYTSGEELGRSIIMPPRVGAERLGMFRKAFQQMLKDPDFQAEVKKARLEYNPLPGEKLQSIVEATINSSPETIARTRKLLGRK